MKPVVDLIFYNDHVKNSVVVVLGTIVLAAVIAGGIRSYNNHQRFEEETRQAQSKLLSLITNEHVSISKNNLRVYADGTNYDFCIEYQK